MLNLACVSILTLIGYSLFFRVFPKHFSTEILMAVRWVGVIFYLSTLCIWEQLKIL